jgi:hypothetical protein
LNKVVEILNKNKNIINEKNKDNIVFIILFLANFILFFILLYNFFLSLNVYFAVFIFIYYYFFKYGFTALTSASYYGHFEILKLLIENNADVNIQDEVFFFI